MCLNKNLKWLKELKKNILRVRWHMLTLFSSIKFWYGVRHFTRKKLRHLTLFRIITIRKHPRNADRTRVQISHAMHNTYFLECIGVSRASKTSATLEISEQKKEQKKIFEKKSSYDLL